MKYISLLLCIYFSVQAHITDTMAVNTWVEVGSNAIEDVKPSPIPPGALGIQAVTRAWSGGTYDYEHHNFLVTGGGHTDYAGNELYAFNLETLTWTRIWGPTPNADIVSGEVYNDGNPSAIHTYDGVEYIPGWFGGCFFRGDGAVWQSGGTDKSWILKFDDTTWVEKATILENRGDARMVWHPDSGYIYHHSKGEIYSGFYAYDTSTNAWTDLAPTGDAINWNKAASSGCINLADNCFYYMGGGAGLNRVNITTNVSKTGIGTTGGSTIEGVTAAGLEFDTRLDSMVAWGGGQTVYIYHHDDSTWYTRSCTGANPGNDETNGTYGRFQYMPEYNAYCLVNTWSGYVYMLKLTEDVLAVDTLWHDGPITPEQISLYLEITEDTISAVSAAVQYKETGESDWIDAHPLHRIRDAWTAESVDEDFAGVITGLEPGTSYNIEVTVVVGPGTNLRTLTTTTRALPSTAGAHTDTVINGSSEATIQTQLDALSPGDVLFFENDTFDVTSLHLDVQGSLSQPIYLVGENRDSTIIRDTDGNILFFDDANYFVIEEFTFIGSNNGSGTSASSRGIEFYNVETQLNITIRNCTIKGVDRGIRSVGPIEGCLIYDCTFTGNNLWVQDSLESNAYWNDDGIQVPGKGNCVFNNTLYGFGDALTLDTGEPNVGIHFYRNDIQMTGDDAFEGDYGYRNITFYDNRIHNAMTFISFDPINGGPAFVFRNIVINTGRAPYKLNSTNTGHFFYNNTVVRTTGYSSGSSWGWVQYNNGAQRAWGYRNNILIWYGGSSLIALESTQMNPIDFTNNAWYPNGSCWWTNSGGSYGSVASAYAGLGATTPIFSGETQRHKNYQYSESNPFIDSVALGANYLTEIISFYTPILTAGSTPDSNGVVIYGITDAYTDPSPDMGAIITGRTIPTYGDRSNGNGGSSAAGPMKKVSSAGPVKKGGTGKIVN